MTQMNQVANKQAVRTGRCGVFIPRSFHVMLTKHDSPEHTTSLTTQTLRVHYMNIFTGEIEHETTLRLKEPTELYFTQAKHFPGFAYVEHYATKLQRFACSCKEGKDCGSCPHIEELTLVYAPTTMEM
jgi:hypothetical protein